MSNFAFSLRGFWFGLPSAADGTGKTISLCIHFLQHWQLFFLRHLKNLPVIGHQHGTCKSCIVKTTGKTSVWTCIEYIEWAKWVDLENICECIEFCLTIWRTMMYKSDMLASKWVYAWVCLGVSFLRIHRIQLKWLYECRKWTCCFVTELWR